MVKKYDYLSEAVKRHAVPVLEKNGFKAHSPKLYYRVRGCLVDVISFSRGSWGPYFYVHFHIHPLFDPAGGVLRTWFIGERFGVDAEKNELIMDSAESAGVSVASVMKRVEHEALPWLESVDGVQAYINKLHREYPENIYRLDEILGLALLGNIEDAVSLCKERMVSLLDKRGVERVADEYFSYYEGFLMAVDEARVGEFLAECSRRNVEAEKIEL